jgi:hypothetical protein
MKPPSTQLPVTEIESLIVTVREQRVILAPDLASLYGMPTKALNQAVKRNADRFPVDFMFRLTLAEAEDMQRSRSQIVTLKRGQNIKYLPAAFTEHGAIMADPAFRASPNLPLFGAHAPSGALTRES